jgi:hypothetical protein
MYLITLRHTDECAGLACISKSLHLPRVRNSSSVQSWRISEGSRTTPKLSYKVRQRCALHLSMSHTKVPRCYAWRQLAVERLQSLEAVLGDSGTFSKAATSSRSFDVQTLPSLNFQRPDTPYTLCTLRTAPLGPDLISWVDWSCWAKLKPNGNGFRLLSLSLCNHIPEVCAGPKAPKPA